MSESELSPPPAAATPASPATPPAPPTPTASPASAATPSAESPTLSASSAAPSTPASAPAPASAYPVHTAPWWLWVALFPVAALVRLWLATLRIRAEPESLARWHAEAGKGRLFLLWHNRLVITPELRRRFSPEQPVGGLVSASKDGAWLSVFFRHLGVRAIRGSSSGRGAAAMLEITRRLNLGEDVGITPDGPRGPCYDWKSSGARLALRTGHPIFLLDLRFHRARRLASWDGFYIPAPFSRVELRLDCLAADDPRRAALAEDALAEDLRQRLAALTDDSGFAWSPPARRRASPPPPASTTSSTNASAPAASSETSSSTQNPGVP